MKARRLEGVFLWEGIKSCQLCHKSGTMNIKYKYVSWMALVLYMGFSHVCLLVVQGFLSQLWFDDPFPQVVLLLQLHPGTTVGGAGTTVEQALLAWRNILNCSELIVTIVAPVSE